MEKRELVFVIIAVLVVLGFWLGIKSGITGFVVLGESKEIVEQDVITELETEEEVKVIVILKEKELEKKFKIAEVEDGVRKTAIKELQNEVLSTVGSNEFELRHKYKTINAFSGILTKAGLKKLQKNPNIKKVYLDRVLHIVLLESIPLINADGAWLKQVNGVNITGEGQTICIVDTGIDTDHSAFSGRILDQYCYCSITDYGLGGCCPDNTDEDNNAEDDEGHGTHCAGIAAGDFGSYVGVAPQTNIIAIKVCNASGSCATSDVIAGIEWCTDNASKYNISAIGMSLGGGGPYNSYCNDDPMAPSIDSAVGQNVLVAVASGNDGWTNGISSPACVENATSVGSIDDGSGGTTADTVSYFTNKGNILDLLAPGRYITAPYNTGGTATLLGTSMATPHVAGAVALICQYEKELNNRNATPDVVRDLLKKGGVSIYDSGGLTFPRIDILASVNSILKINETENSAESGFGKVAFETVTDLTEASVAFEITNNSIYLNASRYPQFNKTANLTLYYLPFAKTPVVLKDGKVCGPPACNITSYISGNFTFKVSSFTNYTAGANSQLAIWDEDDPGMPYYDSKPKYKNNIYFYANYTNRTSGQLITDADCNITFSDFSALMSYNSTKKLFQCNRTFDTVGLQNYDISCNRTSYETLNLSDSITIGIRDWIINESTTEIRTNEEIYVINGSVEVRDDSSLVLINSTLILSRDIDLINITDNANFTAYNSLIKSENSSITFNLNFYGYGDLYSTTLINGTRAYFNGNKTHSIVNCTFGQNVYFQENSINYVTNSTFMNLDAAGGLNYVRTLLSSNNTFQNSVFNGEIKLEDNSINIIQNSQFTNLTHFFDNSNNKIQNSTFKQTYIYGTNSILNFTQPRSNITDDSWFLETPTIYGYVDMPPNTSHFDPVASVSRFYPVYVYYVDTTNPVFDRTVNITDVGNNLIWNGTTNAAGYVQANLTLNSTNYGEGNFTILVNDVQNISLLTDTPIILEVGDTEPPIVNLTSPENGTWLNYGINIELNYTVNDAESGIANCSLYWDGELNQTDTDVQEGVNQTFWINASDNGHNWSVACYDNSTNANFGSSDVWLLNIDTIYPLIDFVLPTEDDSTYFGRDWIFVNVSVIEAKEANITFVLYNQTGPVNSTTFTDGTHQINFTNLPEGDYWYNVTVFDLVGNSNSTETRVQTLDTTQPLIDFIPPTPLNNTYTNNPIIVINVSHTEANPDTLVLNWNGTNQSQSYSGGFTNITQSVSVDGVYFYYVWINDSTGNSNQTETRIVTIDTTKPAIVLNVTPITAEYLYQNVSVNWSIIEVNLDTSYLNVSWPNGSLLGQYNTNITLTTDNLTVPGNYTILVWANDSAGNVNQTTVTLVVQDSTSPKWSDNKTSPISPVIYLPGAGYQFNITWINGAGIDSVWFEHNFTGSFDNYPASGNVSSEYYYNWPDLPAGTYVWKSLANDSAGNINITDQWYYIVNKATSSINLLINNTSSDFRQNVSFDANLTCELITPSSGNVNLSRDGSTLNYGPSPQTNISTYSIPGDYLINCSYAGNQNYTVISESHYVNATDENSLTVTLVYPLPNYYNDSSDPVNVTFNCSATDNYNLRNISLWITDKNNQSFSLNKSNIITGIYNSSNWTLSLSNGNYTWNCLAYDEYNNSAWEVNRTVKINFTPDNPPYWSNNQTNIVATYSPTTKSYFNITWQDDNALSIVWFESDYNGISKNYSMNNLIGDIYNYSAILPAGTYYWKSYANDTADQWNESDKWTFTIAKVTSTCSLTFDQTSPLDYNMLLTVTCSCTNPEGTTKLYRNGTDVTATENGTAVILAVGDYNYTCNTTATQNYTAATNSSVFTIQQISSEVNLTLNGIDDNISIEVYSNVNATGYRIAGEGDIELYREGVLINSGASPLSNITNETITGTFNYTVVYPATQNYSRSEEAHWVTVVDNRSPYWNNNKTAPASGVTYSSGASYQFNVSWFDNYQLDTILIEHNFTGNLQNVSMGNISNEYYYDYSDLAAGTYVWRSYANDTAGLWNYTDQWVYIVQKATGSISLYLNGSTNNITIQNNSYVNISAVLINGTGNIQVYKNGSLIYMGSSPNENITLFDQAGEYNITAVYSGNQNYTSDSETWWVIAVIGDITPPIVTLVSPAPGYPSTVADVTFECNATDNVYLQNITLYTSIGGWQANQTKEITGIANQTTFDLTSIPDGSYQWNCYGCDNSSNCAFGAANRTFTISTPSPPPPSAPGGGGAAPCTPKWECGNWSECSPAGIRERTCWDLNKCGTLKGKPIEIESCTYIPPEEDERPRGSGCRGRWNCSDWGECINGTQYRTCIDFGTLDEWKWYYCMTTAYEPETERACEMPALPIIEKPKEICPIPWWAIVVLAISSLVFLYVVYRYDIKYISREEAQKLINIAKLKATLLLVIIGFSIYLYYHACLPYKMLKLALILFNIFCIGVTYIYFEAYNLRDKGTERDVERLLKKEVIGKRYTCPLCKAVFKSKKNYSKHVKECRKISTRFKKVFRIRKKKKHRKE